MFFLRRHRIPTVLVALCSMLFMQLALAGYFCPGFEARVQEISAMAQAGMPCAQEMSMTADSEQPNLCHAQCQSVKAGADTPALQVPAALIDHSSFFDTCAQVPPRQRMNPPTAVLARATAPPLAIRNCCWRI